MATYRIEDFLEVKASFAPAFSPDASRIAYLNNDTGTSQLYLIPREGGERTMLTDFPDSITSFAYSPTEEAIIFSKAEGGNENAQLYFLDVITRGIKPLTDKKTVRHNLGSFSRDGRYVSYASNEGNGKDFDVYVMDMRTHEARRIFSPGGMCAPAGFSPTGGCLAVRKIHSSENGDVYLCDLQTGTADHVTPHDGNVSYGPLRWLPDESAFFMTTDKDVEFNSLIRYSMADKRSEYMMRPRWDIEGIGVSKDGRYLAVSLNEDGYHKVSIYDPVSLKQLPHEFPPGEIHSLTFSHDGKYVALAIGDSRRTVDVWIAETATGGARQLTRSFQGVPPEVLVEPELVRFKSFDGLEIPVFAYKPQNAPSGDKKLPVIISIHGGPESQYAPSLAPITQYFVHAGYMVVAPNVRGSSGYGKTYMALDNVRKRMDSVKDIVALRDHLKTMPEADMDRIVVMGGSYGGFMVMACLAFYPNLWAAGIDTVGIVNFVTFLENTAPYRRALREAEYGSLEKDRAFLESISPIRSVEEITASLFVIHGANDPRVPLSEAEQVVEKLRSLGREVEFLVYPDEGHGLSKLKNRLDAYPKVVKFLEKVLARE